MKDIIRVLKKYRMIMSRGQKLRIGIIIVMMLIGGVLETMSVSLILPLVTAIMQPDFIESNTLAKWVCTIFDLHSANTFMILVIAGLMILYIVKNSFLFLQYYTQTRFVCNNRFALQERLMRSYITRPYEYFLNESTGEVMRVIQSDVHQSFLLLSTLMNLFTELTISVALVATIVIVDPMMSALVAMTLLIVMIFIGRVLKPILRKIGLDTQQSVASANKWLMQTVHGIKELKVAHRENYFVEQYSKAGRLAIECEKKNTVINSAPRLLIETVTIVAMLGVIGIMLLNGKSVTQLMPQLSAFAMAAVRLLPSANRVISAYNGISYQEPMLDKMIENLRDVSDWDSQYETSTDMSTNRVTVKNEIKLENITYAYPNTEQAVLERAQMCIPVGKSVGVVGASGAGKTTAIDILLGLLKPQSGQVLSDGKNIEEDYNGWLSHLSYIPQTIYMLDDTIRANVAFGFDLKKVSDEQIWRALREAQLEEFVKSLPEGLDTSIGERGVRLSGGQRQRIGIARALFTDPELIILDEATSALDNETEAAIMDAINALHGKKTLIIIAHRLTTIEECDMVYRVENGQINEER